MLRCMSHDAFSVDEQSPYIINDGSFCWNGEGNNQQTTGAPFTNID